MPPTMSRLEPGKRDIILLNLDVKVFSYFFHPTPPSHMSLISCNQIGGDNKFEEETDLSEMSLNKSVT